METKATILPTSPRRRKLSHGFLQQLSDTGGLLRSSPPATRPTPSPSRRWYLGWRAHAKTSGGGELIDTATTPPICSCTSPAVCRSRPPTRLVRLLHLPRRDGQSLHEALKARMGDLPDGLLRSITWDQGTELARHIEITKSLGTPVYFCDSHSPWQRGLNENTNGLLRDYFPTGTDLSVHSPEHLLAVENELNRRPRKVLGDLTPAALFEALLASPDQSALRR